MQTAKSATTKETILSRAVKIASRDGIGGLTIGELAKAVGMSKSGLFAHFGGKDQLQLDVLKLATDKFVEVVMRPAFAAPRGEPRIKAMFKNWLEHLNDESELPGGSILISASIELDDRPGVLRDFAAQAQKDLIKNIEKAAKLAVQEGHFRRDLDVEQFAWSMYSFVLGYHHFKRLLKDPKAELHVKRSFNGLLAISRATQTSSSRKQKK
jgi:AcrR family transcriptional regulator